ncbi:class I SAM-dependent methyltransferase [Zavarzinia aquatilis]|nr:class I SAM-dependent methyltransferase [Zavarzinia aquatilis]
MAESSSFSFTALYTGETWQASGLSLPELRTPAGDVMYRLLGPAEWAANAVFGTNLRQSLVARHALIDRLVIGHLQDWPDAQILEIACGLSARGCRFARQFPELRYVEADLPAMAANKARALARIPGRSRRHEVVPIDILAPSGPHALETVLTGYFDRTRPLIVITEGLMNYFPRPVATHVWRRLAEALRGFPCAGYVMETYPAPKPRLLRAVAGAGAAALRLISRSHAGIHFRTADQAARHLSGAGFAEVDVVWPAENALLCVLDCRTGTARVAGQGG